MTVASIAVQTSATRPSVRHRVRLDGRDFIVWLDWSSREDAWYAHIFDASGAPIVTGRKVVADGKIGHRTSDSRRPAGRLFAVAPSGGGDPKLDDLGRRVFLVYADAVSIGAAA